MGLDKLVEDEAFTFKQGKDNKQIMIVKGKKAQKLVEKLLVGTNEENQLLLAKVTGNFKRGNERLVNKQKS
uniref:Uncharacterized protein n=1 Tax=Candidatus Enterococcus clewellii TaxID=1834193 RepID=A0A242KD94_9ENTE|nr:hypothetical protein [Enterococcus sp. 9E7_DIV0242]OTP18758.1 hypothetical protein A5888_000572 [Enterococcus sp. 9E7_DIV0242]